MFAVFKNKMSVLNSPGCRETVVSKIVAYLITVNGFNFSIYTETRASSKITFVPNEVLVALIKYKLKTVI